MGGRCRDDENGRYLRATLSLLHALKGRDASLTLGDLQSLADDFGENYDDNYRERDNRHGKGRGGGGIVDSGGMSLFSLIGTPPVPVSEDQVPLLLEARSDEFHIVVPLHRSGHGIRRSDGRKVP